MPTNLPAANSTLTLLSCSGPLAANRKETFSYLTAPLIAGREILFRSISASCGVSTISPNRSKDKPVSWKFCQICANRKIGVVT